MFHKILPNDPIFKSPVFLKDAIPFNVMTSIIENDIKYPERVIFADGDKCIVVNSDPHHPVIIWTADDFDPKNYPALLDFLRGEFTDHSPLEFMTKKEFRDFLQAKGLIFLTPQSHALLAYSCTKLIPIPYKGTATNITDAEVPEVADCYAQFGIETGTDITATQENKLETAKDFITSPLHKVWRDEEGKIVAIAKINATEKYGRIGAVYTKKEARGKHYAGMLVHFLTQAILKSGKIPMLFTNADYPPSNKCYRRLGYQPLTTIFCYGVKTTSTPVKKEKNFTDNPGNQR